MDEEDFRERILKDYGGLVYTNYGWRPKTLCDLPTKELKENRERTVIGRRKHNTQQRQSIRQQE